MPVMETSELTARQYDSGDTNRLAAAPTDAYAREWRALLQRLEPPARASFRD